MKLAVILFILFATGFTKARASTENEIFDAQKISAMDLLRKNYEESQILLIGAANHSNYRLLAYLGEFLQTVKDDPRLKYVLLERFGDNAEFFHELSLKPFDEVMKSYSFASDLSEQNSLCASAEWTYTVTNFMPVVQEINKSRADHPVLVSSVDSMDSRQEIYWPGNQTIHDGTCHLNPSYASQSWFAVSGNREAETADNFRSTIWANLKPNEKVIVVYHQAHLMTGWNECFPDMQADGSWTSNWAKSSWFDLFSSAVPAAKAASRLVLMDEMDQYQNPHSSIYAFTERQSARYPNADFAVPLAPFTGVLTEKGTDMYAPNSFFLSFLAGERTSDETLPDIGDGLIWTHDAEENYQLDTPDKYLPGICKPDSTPTPQPSPSPGA